jgi:hypothetical protein
VDFRIPPDAQPTDKRNIRDQFVWILEALADVPGVNYHDIFEVPVFRTQQTPSKAQSQVSFKTSEFAQAIARPDALTVEVRQTAEGTEFYFPAARNKKFATWAAVCCLAFDTITVFLIHAHVFFILPLAFGCFALLFTYVALRLWLGTSRILVGSSSLDLQDGFLGGGKVKQIPLSDISSITDRITSQQGGGTGTPYYDIELTLRDGEKLTLGRTLQDKHETTWLVGEMQRLAGLPRKSMSVGTS